MARALIASDNFIRSLRPETAPYRLLDGDGLYLRPFLGGRDLHAWRFDYGINGKRKTLSLGLYPDTSLRLAREKAKEFRQLVAEGIDPSDVRKSQRKFHAEQRSEEERIAAGLPPTGSFEQVARDWWQVRSPEWSEAYASRVLGRLENEVFPRIGQLPIASITAPQLLGVIRQIEARGVIETAHRTLEACNQVFAFAIATGLATSIPGRDLKVALRKPVPRHFPAILDPERLGEVLRSIEGYQGTATVRTCLLLTPMLLLRPGELRLAEWSEVDLESGIWTIPASRMKLQKQQKLAGPPHIVTLPRQALTALRDLHLLTGHQKFVFSGARPKRPLSNNTVNSALRNMGYSAEEVVAHGFRATARTMLAEILGVKPLLIEAQLAHTIKDASVNSNLGTAYDRAKWLRHRAAMLQLWADYLDHLRYPDRHAFKVPELQLIEAIQLAG